MKRQTVPNRPWRFALLAMTGLMLILAGCATPPTDPAERAEFDRTNDPLEPMNRKILDFNMFIDRILLKPVALGYRAVLPQYARNRIRDFLNNLNEPVVFVNDTLQGQFKRADTTVGRFLFNSTFGVGGIWDRATDIGLEKQTGDFGQTLYSWGVPDGPYLVLPILGPSDPRDAIGMAADSYMDPFLYIGRHFGGQAKYNGLYRWVVTGIDERERNIETLDDLQKNAIDFYAELRSLWRQHRASELRHGEPAPTENPGLYEDPNAKP
jgi:phospholipid-binding lipoprotein MlaA